MKKLTAGLACLALLSACGGEPEAAPTVTATSVSTVTATATTTATTRVTVTATPSPSAPEPGRAADAVTAPIVDDVEHLLMLVRTVGLVCENWEPIVEDMAGNCSGGTMLNAFPDSADGRTAHRASVRLAWTAISTQERADVALLVGPNWFIRADVDGAYTLQDLIGGSVVGLT